MPIIPKELNTPESNFYLLIIHKNANKLPNFTTSTELSHVTSK